MVRYRKHFFQIGQAALFAPQAASGLHKTRKCSACGGNLTWHPGKNALACEHCGNTETFTVPAGVAQEVPLAKGLSEEYQNQSSSAVAEQLEFVCQNCGATTQTNLERLGQNCPFCGSPQIKPSAFHGRMQPQGLIPFAVDEDAAKQHYKSWLSGLWFRPSNLQKVSQLDSLIGIYVPYWTFDAEAESQWTAERGDYYYEEYRDSNGQTQRRQHTRWSFAQGYRQDTYDDLLVCGSQGLPRELVDKFSTFETNRALPFQEEFLLGWVSECYNVTLSESAKISKSRMIDGQERRCAGDVGGDTHRSLRVRTQFSEETFKHILLPLWSCAFMYSGKRYQFFVNAQTGEIHGKAPYSWVKILSLIVAIVTFCVWFFGFTNAGRQILRNLR